MLAIFLFAVLALFQPTQAAPLSFKKFKLGALTAASKTAVTALLGPSFESDFLRPALFSRLVYCSSEVVQTLQCGGPCDELGDGVQVLQTGGDGGRTPRFFIASDNSTQTIVVAHQGTDSKEILSIANDAKFDLDPLDPVMFPTAPDGVQVHSGFQAAFLRTAADVKAGVDSALLTTGFTNVLVTGHSLGAAIATMDTLMLKMTLGDNVTVTGKVFGLPRGGNQGFADLIDSMLGDSFKFVTNQNDPVPAVPPRFLNFQHSQGELHIKSSDVDGNPTSIITCTGQENVLCVEGNSLLKASVTNHKGPYLRNISMSRSNCPL